MMDTANKKKYFTRYEYALEIMAKCLRYLRYSEITEISSKTKEGQLVTNIDHDLNRIIVDEISNNYEDNIVGEELSSRGNCSNNWYIDPIDGTTNYIYRKCDYAISIAYEGEEGKFGLVYDVEANVFFHGYSKLGMFINGVPFTRPETPEFGILFISFKELADIRLFKFAQNFKGIRNLDVCTLEIMKVITGQASCFYRTGQEKWDYKAAAILAELSGVNVQLFDEETILVGTRFTNQAN